MPLSPALKLVIFIFAAFAFAYLTFDILDGGAWGSSIVQSSSEKQFISRKLWRPVISTAKEESEEEQKENDKTADRSPTEIGEENINKILYMKMETFVRSIH